MPELSILIPASHGYLEVNYSEGEALKPIMIMCHPHPLMGGTMTNKVVTTVTRAFHAIGCTAVRFNFSGIGQSTGSYGYGQGETEDVLTVIRWAQEKWLHQKIILGGFSFGAYVALSASQQFKPDALLLLAPAVDRMDFSNFTLPDTLCYLVIAKNDEVVSTPAILEWAADKSFKQIFNIEGASHFFHGKLLELRDIITEEFK